MDSFGIRTKYPYYKAIKLVYSRYFKYSSVATLHRKHKNNNNNHIIPICGGIIPRSYSKNNSWCDWNTTRKTSVRIDYRWHNHDITFRIQSQYFTLPPFVCGVVYNKYIHKCCTGKVAYKNLSINYRQRVWLSKKWRVGYKRKINLVSLLSLILDRNKWIHVKNFIWSF